jgi:hypothetical protein
MRKAILLGAVAGALALGLAATSTAAAPFGGVAQQTTEPESLVEKVHCRWFWHRGHWHCSRRHHFFVSGFFPFSPFVSFGFFPRRHFFVHRHRHCCRHW